MIAQQKFLIGNSAGCVRSPGHRISEHVLFIRLPKTLVFIFPVSFMTRGGQFYGLCMDGLYGAEI